MVSPAPSLHPLRVPADPIHGGEWATGTWCALERRAVESWRGQRGCRLRPGTPVDLRGLRPVLAAAGPVSAAGRRWVLAGGAGALLVLQLGCSGGSVGPVVAQEEYVAAANSICAQAKAQAPVPAEMQVRSSDLDRARWAVSVYELALGQLKVLPRPRADERLLGDLYDDAAKAIAKVNQVVRAVEEQRAVAAYRNEDEARRLVTDLVERAQAYGLTECSSA